MLVHSTKELGSAPWYWINIPKTGSTAIFVALYGEKAQYMKQDHLLYTENLEEYGLYINGFGVIRDPLTRFRSGINHFVNECACGKCVMNYDNKLQTEDVIAFLQDLNYLLHNNNRFHEDCYYNGHNDLWIEVVKSMQRRFIKSRILYSPENCVMWSFILAQYMYLDKMPSRDYIYRYEEPETWKKFIEGTLGYPIDLSAKYRSYPNKLQEVDFDNLELQQLAYEFFKRDYQELNYKPKYLQGR